MSTAFLKVRADLELALPNYRVILINATSGLDENDDAAVLLNQEVLQSSGGYASQAYTYTAGSSTYDSTLGREVAPSVTVSFTEAVSGSGYDFTHVALWQGRGSNSNKLITFIDPSTDRVTCPAHGVVTGNLGFVRSTGADIGLATQRYYLSAVDADTLEFYEDSSLTTKADITSTGSGSQYLVYADGRLVKASSYGLVHVSAGQTSSFVVSYRFG
jgi:hypothetical protein